MPDIESPTPDRSAKLALIAVAAVILLVLGAVLIESLRRPPGEEEPGPGEGGLARGNTDARDARALPDPTGGEEPLSPTTAGEFVDTASWRELLRRDPEAAASALGKLEAGNERDELLGELMAHWTKTAPQAAGRWLLAQPNGEFRDEAAADFAREWAAHRPEAAAQWVARHVETAAAQQAIGGLVSKWTAQDPEAAQEWVDALEHAGAARQASSALAYAWVQSEPQAAARWVAGLKDPALRTTAAVNLINAWSEQDPPAAAAWLSANLTDPGERDAAAVPLLMAWADRDPRAASQWVAALPGGALQETSKVIFAESMAVEAPEDAVVWARSIANPEQRNESILNIYEDWLYEDSTALLTHLRGNLAANADPGLREEIYDLLYDHDPQFRDELLRLYEERDAP